MTCHKPVMLQEVLSLLDLKPGEFMIDGTYGGGGHALECAKKIGEKGIVLGIDWSKSAFLEASVEAKGMPQIILENANFRNIPEIIRKHGLRKADGLLLDLGFSSDEVSEKGPKRGMSFRRDEPLLMTYSDEMKPVCEWLEELSESKLEQVIKEYGEERYSRQIAKAIKDNVPIHTTEKLRSVIVRAVGRRYERRIDPATRTCMALRIFANQELENVKEILNRLDEVMAQDGRVAVLSFHSLEDRIVKKAFKEWEDKKQAVRLTKKPITPSYEEVQQNRRSRSAKLRGLKWLSTSSNLS